MEDTLHTLEYDKLPKFLLGGKADFVIKNRTSGNHINFMVKKSKFNESFNVWYKSHKWVKIGYINVIDNLLKFRRDVNFVYISNNEGNIEKANIFASFIRFIYVKEKLPNDIDILYTARCCMCGRKLTDPDYIKIGIGKYCLENS